jgi:hypothetical protein
MSGGRRTLHDAELGKLHSAPDIMRLRWAGNATSMVEMRIAYKILVGRLEGKTTRKT